MQFDEFETHIPDWIDLRPIVQKEVRRYGHNTPEARDNSSRGPDGHVLWAAKATIGYSKKPPNLPNERDDQRDDPIAYYTAKVNAWSREDPSKRGDKRLALAVFYWFFIKVLEPSYFREIARHVWPHSSEPFMRFVYAKGSLDYDSDPEAIEARFRAEFSEVRNEFSRLWIVEKPPFRLELPTRSSQIYHYTNPAIEILGRDEERAALERFRDAGPGFRWWQIAGVGGQGKSRLALDLTQKTRKHLPDWRAGNIDREGLEQSKAFWRDWIPTRPHLIVIDYVLAVLPAVKAALQILSSRRDEFSVAIRLLIVERDPWDLDKSASNPFLSPNSEWYGRVKARPGLSDEKLETSRFQDSYGDAFENHIELKQLDDASLVSIVKQTACLEVECGTNDHDKILQKLKVIDDAGRPLYAYFLGLALKAGKTEETSSSKALLNWVLDSDRVQRWSAEIGNAAPECGDDPPSRSSMAGRNPSMRIALIATMIRRIDCRNYPQESGWAKPDSDVRRQALVLCASPVPAGPSPIEIVGLQPDLLGVWFVLRSVSLGASTEWLSETAWKLDAAKMVEFLSRIVQDFPDLPETKSMLALYPPKFMVENEDLHLRNSDPISHKKILSDRIHVFRNQGDWAAVVRYSWELIKEIPRYPFGWIQISIALHRCGEIEKSRYMFEKTVGLFGGPKKLPKPFEQSVKNHGFDDLLL